MPGFDPARKGSGAVREVRGRSTEREKVTYLKGRLSSRQAKDISGSVFCSPKGYEAFEDAPGGRLQIAKLEKASVILNRQLLVQTQLCI